VSRYLYDPDGAVVAVITGYDPDGCPEIEELEELHWTLDEIRRACDIPADPHPEDNRAPHQVSD
jgi:hypothetical protein